MKVGEGCPTPSAPVVTHPATESQHHGHGSGTPFQEAEWSCRRKSWPPTLAVASVVRKQRWHWLLSAGTILPTSRPWRFSAVGVEC